MKLLATAVSALALSTLAVAGAASAQDGHLSYGDLDLSTKAGARTLDQRISGLSQEMCGGYGGLEFARCARRVRAEVMIQLQPAAREELARARDKDDQVQLAAINN